MKVLHICESVTGGIATYLNELLPYQIELYGIDNVQVVIPRSQRNQIQRPPQVIRFFDEVNRKSLRSQVKMASTYLKCVKDFSPSAVHLHSTYAGFWFRLPLFFVPNRKYKLFYCSHGWAFDMDKSLYAKSAFALVERFLSAVTDKIICISDHDLNSAVRRGVKSEKLIVVKNTINQIVDDIEPAHVDPSVKNFLFVGRFDKQKGFDQLLEAIQSSSNQDFKVYCIGQPVVEGDHTLNRILAENDKIVHLGWKTKSEVLQYMKSCDALIMPSRWEGFGLVALESLCCGCPVYHSGAGGLAELYPDSNYSVTLDTPIVDSITDLIDNTTKASIQAVKNSLLTDFKLTYTTKDLSMEIHKLYEALDNIGRDRSDYTR